MPIVRPFACLPPPAAPAGAFRIFLMPIDTVKTIMQVGIGTLCSGPITLRAACMPHKPCAEAGASWTACARVRPRHSIMQVEGKEALAALGAKVRATGPGALYHGALAASAATFVGHYPWFATYNYLNAYLPKVGGSLGGSLGG